MPRSKRDKKVSLTKTASKGRDQKAAMMGKLRETLDQYTSLYVFSFEHMRSSKFKDVRVDWRDSRFFMGKNKVMQKALGITAEDEYRDNVRRLAKRLTGQVGLLATNRTKEEVVEYFKSFSVKDFAKAGTVAPSTIVLAPDNKPLEFFPTSMFNLFRKLGMNLEVRDGKLELLEPYTAATEGEPLTVEQAKVMAQLDMPLVDFKIQLLCRWCDGGYEDLDTDVPSADTGSGQGSKKAAQVKAFKKPVKVSVGGKQADGGKGGVKGGEEEGGEGGMDVDDDDDDDDDELGEEGDEGGEGEGGDDDTEEEEK